MTPSKIQRHTEATPRTLGECYFFFFFFFFFWRIEN